jgi:hypothetical protein
VSQTEARGLGRRCHGFLDPPHHYPSLVFKFKLGRPPAAQRLFAQPTGAIMNASLLGRQAGARIGSPGLLSTLSCAETLQVPAGEPARSLSFWVGRG